jgi:hypothetical protein
MPLYAVLIVHLFDQSKNVPAFLCREPWQGTVFGLLPEKASERGVYRRVGSFQALKVPESAPCINENDSGVDLLFRGGVVDHSVQNKLSTITII